MHCPPGGGTIQVQVTTANADSRRSARLLARLARGQQGRSKCCTTLRAVQVGWWELGWWEALAASCVVVRRKLPGIDGCGSLLFQRQLL